LIELLAKSDLKRLFNKIDFPNDWKENPKVLDLCWKYLGGVDKDGYGRFWLKYFNNNVYAHRLVYEYYMGEIPKSLCVCHTCDNPPCCNPNHLFVGTSPENTMDKVSKERQNKGESVWTARLTEDQVIKILEDILDHKYNHYYEIAIDYGVHRDTIGKIIFGRNWKHITCNYDLQSIKEMVIARV